MTQQWRFTRRDPGVGYTDWAAWLPKSGVNEQVIRASMEIELTNGERLILWHDAGRHLIVPREYLHSAGLIDKVQFPIVSNTPTFERVSFTDRVKIRDHQQDSWAAFSAAERGLLEVSTGHGKTILALKRIAQERAPAIVVVNRDMLLKQWHEHAREFLGLKDDEIGIVQGKDDGSWRGKKLCVAMLHTLSMYADDWPLDFRLRFGIALYDEVHRLAADQFARAAPLFWGRRFGLSATMKRTDGAEAVYYTNIGKVFHTDMSTQLTPTFVFQRTTFHVDMDDPAIHDKTGELNISLLRRALVSASRRNTYIAGHVLAAVGKGRRCLVLGHIVEGLQNLAALIPGSVVIASSTPTADRLKIFREAQVVLATNSMATEGVDSPDKDTVFYTTPFRDWKELQQGTGRILRTHPGKRPPLAVLFEDDRIPPARGMMRHLRTELKKRGHDVTIVEASDPGDPGLLAIEHGLPT